MFISENTKMTRTLVTLAFICLISGCATPLTAFRQGDTVIAQNFSRHPKYNGLPVTVTGVGWRWIKECGGCAMQVYEIETVDGERLAAQEFQLRRIKK
jgi:hypothetical protein